MTDDHSPVPTRVRTTLLGAGAGGTVRPRGRARLLAAAPVAALLLPLVGASPVRADPPAPQQVQVTLPLIDGGITVYVAPGAPAGPGDSGTASNPGKLETPVPGAPPPVPSSPPLSSPTVAPPSPETSPSSTDGTPDRSTVPPSPTTPSALSGDQRSWPPLPTARPTFVTDSGPTTPPRGDATRPTRTSGDFLLGVFAHSTDRISRFQQKVGRPVEVLGVFPTRGSWASIKDPWWMETAPPDFHGVLDVGVPLWQDDGDLATAAAGGDDAHWEELGRMIHERYPGSSVRIGWEFNLGGWHHHASEDNVEQWKQAFRRASTALKKGGPSLLVSWNPNKGRGDSLPDADRAWPGDDVVDLVALDAYDWWPAYNESTWPEHRDGDQGWRHWLEFARTHRKKFAVPEWGVAPGNDHSGGDNPFYISAVMEFLRTEHAKDGIVHSAVYFDETAPFMANSIADGQVPMAAEALTKAVADLPRSGSSPTTDRRDRPTPDSPPAASQTSAPPLPHERTAPGDAPSAAQTVEPTEFPLGSPSGAVHAPDPPRTWESADGHGPVPR